MGSLLGTGDQIEYNQYPAQAVSFLPGMDSEVQSIIQCKEKKTPYIHLKLGDCLPSLFVCFVFLSKPICTQINLNLKQKRPNKITAITLKLQK